MLKIPRFVLKVGVGCAKVRRFEVQPAPSSNSAQCACRRARLGEPLRQTVRWLTGQSTPAAAAAAAGGPQPAPLPPEEEDRESLRIPVAPDETVGKTPTTKTSSPSPGAVRLVGALKPDSLGWYKCEVAPSALPSLYLKLSKSRLTGLVVATAMGGYALAPGAFDPLVVALACLGTGLLSASANAVNQTLEVPFDSQMDRTRNRVLVRRVITPLHAVTFAVVSATTGAAILWLGVNGLCAGLGLLNLVLYTCVYTPSKRLTVANTWLGSVVGAIPPLMGWVACTGALDPGAFVLAGLLYTWQFPHFNALSWNLRPDYSRAGYRMMSVTDPGLCVRTTVRYSILTGAICSLAAPLLGVTTWTFAVDSLPLNAYLVYLSAKFYKERDSNSSRKLFRFSLVYLPAVMMLMIISKKEWKQHSAHEVAIDTSTSISMSAETSGAAAIVERTGAV